MHPMTLLSVTPLSTTYRLLSSREEPSLLAAQLAIASRGVTIRQGAVPHQMSSLLRLSNILGLLLTAVLRATLLSQKHQFS